MNPLDYTEEQKKDISERTEKAMASLKELELAPQAQVSKGKIVSEGKEFFVDMVTPFLMDLKYPNLKISTDVVQEGSVPSNDPEINPAI